MAKNEAAGTFGTILVLRVEDVPEEKVRRLPFDVERGACLGCRHEVWATSSLLDSLRAMGLKPKLICNRCLAWLKQRRPDLHAELISKVASSLPERN